MRLMGGVPWVPGPLARPKRLGASSSGTRTSFTLLYHSGKKSGRTGSLKKIKRLLEIRDRHPFTGLLSHGCVITQLWCPHHAFTPP